MKRTLLVLLTALTAAAGPTTASAAPTTQPTHDRDPWIFRCVLDDNARMVVISLGQHVWAAYDTEHCTLAKIWLGEIDLTGAVYDTRHGPQPHAKGVMLIEKPIELLPIDPSGDAAASRRYIGYQLANDRATLHFESHGVSVSDTLDVESVDAAQKTVTVRRTITVDGASEQHPVALDLVAAGESRVRNVERVAGDVQVTEDGRRGNWTRPGNVSLRLTFDATPAEASPAQ